MGGMPHLSRVYAFRTKRGAETVFAQALAEDQTARLELRRDAREAVDWAALKRRARWAASMGPCSSPQSRAVGAVESGCNAQHTGGAPGPVTKPRSPEPDG